MRSDAGDLHSVLGWTGPATTLTTASLSLPCGPLTETKLSVPKINPLGKLGPLSPRIHVFAVWGATAASWERLDWASTENAAIVIRDFVSATMPKRFRFLVKGLVSTTGVLPYLYLTVKLACFDPLAGHVACTKPGHSCYRRIIF